VAVAGPRSYVRTPIWVITNYFDRQPHRSQSCECLVSINTGG
jgi:hypothetical protein